MVILTGQVPKIGLPEVRNLRRYIVAKASIIRWNVSEEHLTGTYEFGIWFAQESNVDFEADPDLTVPQIFGMGEYQIKKVQQDDEYVFVAAFTQDALGPVARLFIPWSSGTSGSPKNQTTIDQ